MKTISVGFSRPRGFKPLAKLIMLIEGTEFSHTYVTWKDEYLERRKVFEAVGSGIRIIGNHYFRSKATIVHLYQFKVSTETMIKIEQYSHDESGKPYSVSQLFGLLYCRVANFFLRALGSHTVVANPFKDGAYSQICVEAGGYILKDIMDLKFTKSIEDCGLREYHQIIESFGLKVSQEKVDEINAKYKQQAA